MPDEPTAPVAPDASVDNSGESTAAKADPAYQQYLKNFARRQTKRAASVSKGAGGTTRIGATTPLTPRATETPAAAPAPATGVSEPGAPTVEGVSAVGGAEAKKLGPQEVEITFKGLFDRPQPLSYNDWLAVLAANPALGDELAEEEPEEEAPEAGAPVVQPPKEKEGKAEEAAEGEEGKKEGAGAPAEAAPPAEAEGGERKEEGAAAAEKPAGEGEEAAAPEPPAAPSAPKETAGEAKPPVAKPPTTEGAEKETPPSAKETPPEPSPAPPPAEEAPPGGWPAKESEEGKPATAAPAGEPAAKPPAAEQPPAGATAEAPREAPETPAEKLSRPPPTEEAPLVRQDEAGRPLPAAPPGGEAPGAPPPAPPTEESAAGGAPAPPRQRSLRDALASAAQMGSERAKLKRARDKFQQELDELEAKIKGVSTSRYLRVLRFFMPKLYAQISGAFDTGKNVAGAARIVALEARLVKLKSAKAALETGKGVGSIVDAAKALIEFIGATSETIIIPILAILAFPLIVFVLALVYSTVGGGTITRAMKKLIDQVDELIKPLQELLNKEKRKIQLRKKIQQIDTALAQRRVLPLRPGVAPGAEEAANDNAAPAAPQTRPLPPPGTPPRAANDNAAPEAGAGGSREAPRLAA
ncbi:MAG: hypothetical protein HYV42_03690 [Candidatus Magasanikbacteria bacterium]|nr:hypothetical protein [Candidatus Magasanikbacteria bacterium]